MRRRRDPGAKKYYAQRVPLDRGGYEKSSGRYWGTGAPLYLVELTEDGRYVDAKHVRAHTASEAKQKAFGYVTKARKPQASRAGKSTWSVEDKIASANAVRSEVASDMLPLFDRLISLARSDAKGEHAYQRRRAGQYIAKAKGMAKKYPRTSGDRSRRRTRRR